MVKKIAWKEVEELLKKTYGLKSVQLTRSWNKDTVTEIMEYPDWIEGVKNE